MLNSVVNSIILIIVIQIIFTSFMDFFLEQIMSLLSCEKSVGFIIIMVLNLLALFSPTLFLVRSVKGINKSLIEASEKNGSERDRIYYGVLQFGTLAFVFIIDLLIIMISPGPFGFLYMVSIAPVILAVFLVSFLIMRHKYKKGEDIMLQDEVPKK